MYVHMYILHIKVFVQNYIYFAHLAIVIRYIYIYIYIYMKLYSYTVIYVVLPQGHTENMEQEVVS